MSEKNVRNKILVIYISKIWPWNKGVSFTELENKIPTISLCTREPNTNASFCLRTVKLFTYNILDWKSRAALFYQIASTILPHKSSMIDLPIDKKRRLDGKQ